MKQLGIWLANETADEITKVSKTSKQNNSEKIKNEHKTEIPKERYISPTQRQKIIDDLRLIYGIIMEYWNIINLLDNTSHQPSKFTTKIGFK